MQRKLRKPLGALVTAVALAVIPTFNAAPLAAAEPLRDPDPSRALLSPAELQKVDIIGACDRLGVGVLHIRLVCSDRKMSECSSRFGPANAAGAIATREEVRLNIKATTLPYSVTSDNVNSATFRTCSDGKPVPMDKIEIANNFTVSGVQLDSCTVGLSGTVSDGGGSGTGSLSCTIKTREDTFGDTEPISCENCSQLNSDVYQWYARWSLGAITRYAHEARATFTGKTGRLRVSSVVDFGI